MNKAGTNAGLGQWIPNLGIQPGILAPLLVRLNPQALNRHAFSGIESRARFSCRQSGRYPSDYLRAFVQVGLLLNALEDELVQTFPRRILELQLHEERLLHLWCSGITVNWALSFIWQISYFVGQMAFGCTVLGHAVNLPIHQAGFLILIQLARIRPDHLVAHYRYTYL